MEQSMRTIYDKHKKIAHNVDLIIREKSELRDAEQSKSHMSDLTLETNSGAANKPTPREQMLMRKQQVRACVDR